MKESDSKYLWPKQPPSVINEKQLEIKRIKVATPKIRESESFLIHLLKSTGNWLKLCRIVATMLKWHYKKSISIDELQMAEVKIIKLVQEVFCRRNQIFGER